MTGFIEDSSNTPSLKVPKFGETLRNSKKKHPALGSVDLPWIAITSSLFKLREVPELRPQQ